MSTAGGFIAGSIIGKLLLDKTGWDSSVKAVEKDLMKLPKWAAEVGSAFNRMGMKMASVGRNLTVGLTMPLVAVGTAATKMAIDAVESESLFEVSMGNMADAARGWSKELSASLGLNQFETRKTIGTFNVMLKSMGQGESAAYGMAQGLTQLGYDMASFYNLKPDEAFQKLQAGISGEVEPLKRLGIVINETTIKTWAMNNGLIKQGETLTEAQKITARYGAIMEQTAMAQGDLARTIDSPANQLRMLKSRLQETAVELGIKLLPLFSDAVGKLNSLAKSFSGLSDETKSVIVQVGLVAAAIGPVLFLVGKFMILVPQVIAGIAGITTAVAASTLGITALAAAAGVAYNIITKLTNAKNAATDADYLAFESNHKLGQKLREVSDAAGLTRAEFHQLSLKYNDNNAAMAVAIKKGKEGKELQEALAKVGREHTKAIEAQKNQMLAMDPAARRLDEQLKDLIAQTQTLKTVTLANLPPARNLNALWARLGAQTLPSTLPPARDLSTLLAEIGKNAEALPESVEPAITETSNMFDGLFNDIAQGFGNTIQEWLSGATTFKDFISGIWGDIKNSFFRAIGQMVAKWTVDFVQKLITDTAEIGKSIAKNISGAIGGAGQAAGSMAGSFLSAAGSIGSIVTGVTSIIGLFKKAPTGAGDGMGRVVERQDQQTAIFQSILDFLRNDVSKALLQYGVDYMAKTMDAANAAVGWLDTINGTLAGMKGAASGAVSTQTQMMMVHGTPSRPEYVIPEPDLRAMLAGVSGSSDRESAYSFRPQNTTIQIYLDKNNKLAEYVLQTVKNGSQTNRLRGLSAQSFA